MVQESLVYWTVRERESGLIRARSPLRRVFERRLDGPLVSGILRCVIADALLCPVSGCAVPGIHLDACHDSGCVGCIPGRVIPPLRVCRHHDRIAEAALSELPALFSALGSVLSGPGRSGSISTFGGKGGGPAIGIRLSGPVSETRQRILANLGRIAAAVVEDRGVTPPVIVTDARVLVAFIRMHHYWLCGGDDAVLYVETILSLRREARARAYPRRSRGVLLGRCPYALTDTGEVCGGEVRFDPSEYAGEQIAQCRGCGLAQEVSAWREVLAPATLGSADYQTTITAVAVETGEQISREQLRQWARRGQVEKGGMKGDLTLYDLPSVMTRVRQMQRDRVTAALRTILSTAASDRVAGEVLGVLPKPSPPLPDVLRALSTEDPLSSLLTLCWPPVEEPASETEVA